MPKRDQEVRQTHDKRDHTRVSIITTQVQRAKHMYHAGKPCWGAAVFVCLKVVHASLEMRKMY